MISWPFVCTNSSTGLYAPNVTFSWLCIHRKTYQTLIVVTSPKKLELPLIKKKRKIKTLPVQRLHITHVHPPHHTPHLVPWTVLYGGYTSMPSVAGKAFMVSKHQFIVLKKDEDCSAYGTETWFSRFLSDITLSLATQCIIAEGFPSWSRSLSRLLPYAKYRNVRLFSMLQVLSARWKMRKRRGRARKNSEEKGVKPSLATARCLGERRVELRVEVETDRNKILAFQHSHTVLMLIPPPAPANEPYSHWQYIVCLICWANSTEPHTNTHINIHREQSLTYSQLCLLFIMCYYYLTKLSTEKLSLIKHLKMQGFITFRNLKPISERRLGVGPNGKIQGQHCENQNSFNTRRDLVHCQAVRVEAENSRKVMGERLSQKPGRWLSILHVLGDKANTSIELRHKTWPNIEVRVH